MLLPRLVWPILRGYRDRALKARSPTNTDVIPTRLRYPTPSYFFAIVMPPSPVRTFNVEPPEPRRPRSSCLLSLSV